MSTTTRPELSQKNKYWIERHRYYELKHFCLQYYIWKKSYSELTAEIKAIEIDGMPKSSSPSKPVEAIVEKRLYFSNRIEMVETVAKNTDEFLGKYILEAVTNGLSYEQLRARCNIPCGKEVYYDLYRRFFWLLDKERA